jgi:DNA-binding NarL/FixJ family response regulator
MSIRVVLADDHAMVREALRGLLERDPGITVVAQAEDGGEALGIARQIACDIVIMDVGMPAMNGIEATRRLLAIQPGIKVIGLSAYKASAWLFLASRAWASTRLFSLISVKVAMTPSSWPSLE